jgi:hypothetical protein
MKQTYMKLFIPPNIGLVVPADLRTNRQLEKLSEQRMHSHELVVLPLSITSGVMAVVQW